MATTSQQREDGPIRSTLVAVGLAAFGILASQFTVLPALLLDPTVITSPLDASIASRTLLLTLNFVGFVLAGAIYLAVTERGRSYVDLRLPTKRGWLYIIAGVLGSFVFYVLVSLVVQLLSLPSAENTVTSYIGDDQTMILVMIGIVFFFNAPAEEFLFRNIVQKRLYDAFSRGQAVVIASAIFALIHVVSYAVSQSLLATVVPVVVVFGGSLIFGYLYAKTDNLFVPIAAHAAFNAIQFGILYIALEYDLETAEPTTSLLVDLAATVPL
ncbi:type II CAAX endopeptidase family protein [Natrinema sp. 1APR25-10V2]|uniref:CPBP family intramembrane glutamic endopeptidase n=1 Tax=Natrinema sp. 1APR25-10V2 TaxID=2951081 RepID=UPI002874CEF0|nr:type II CAAX endopeptidase family protein [Natrinema sp. 1APR25-10V2]MDS0476312.1 CPBP family intramembrane metalloprotease [Natrinema sp. 1APR25-10V2]